MQAETLEAQTLPRPTVNPQQAILLALWDHTDPHLQALNVDCVSTPVMGRPFVQRAIEELAALGCLSISVVTREQDLACEQLLGCGERFGVTLKHVGVNALKLSQTFLNAQRSPLKEPIWIASARTVPNDETLHRLIAQSSVSGTTIVVTDHDANVRWAGWGIFNRALAMTLILESVSEQDLERAVLSDPAYHRTQCTNALTLQSGATALPALIDFMEQGHPAGIVTTRMRSPGVWIAGDSSIHSSATLKPPIYIGHQVRIDADAVVGPGVVIEEGSIVEVGAFIQNSWILPHTYVGHQTTLSNAIVSGNRLLSLDHKVAIKVADPYLLDGDAQTRTAPAGPGRLERLIAIVLWLMAKPLVYWWQRRLRLTPQPVHVREHRVAFPDRLGYGFNTQATALRPTMHGVRVRLRHALAIHFFKTFYPGLKDVWHGRVKFIGLEPYSLDAVQKLSHTEQLRYAHYPIGLINTSILMDHDRKEIQTSQGMPLHRSAQLVLAYGKRVRRSVARAIAYDSSLALPNDIEPQFKQVSRTEQMMTLSQIKPGIAVVLITDESLDIHNVKAFRAEINPIFEQNHAILLDMRRLSFIDSAGLSELLDCLRVATKKQATFRLFGMSQTVQALFKLVRLNRVFTTYTSDVEALQNLPQG